MSIDLDESFAPIDLDERISILAGSTTPRSIPDAHWRNVGPES
jgi:hypothetical protein